MTRLARPDTTHIPEAMRKYPVPFRHMRIGRTVSHAPTLVDPYCASYAAVLQDLVLDPSFASWRSSGWPKPRHTSWSSTARSHESLV